MTRLLVGTYGDAGMVTLARTDGRWSVGAVALPARNVSFAVRSRAGVTYVVDERAHRISGWRGGKRLFDAPSWGEDPCHLALSPDERWLAVANYGDGTVALLPLREDGTAGCPGAVFRGAGSGPDAERQSGPHAHWTGFTDDGATLYATDLGADCIHAFAIDREHGLAGERVAYRAPPGSGPRHLLLLGAHAYLVGELDATLTELALDGDALAARGTHRLGGTDALGGALCFDPVHRLLHVTSRGNDQIASFGRAADGTLTPLREIASGGASPRELLIHDGRLFVAHEEGGSVAVFLLDADGLPGAPEGVIDVPGAAFLMIEEDAR